MIMVNVLNVDEKNVQFNLASVPDCCPVCRKGGQPNFLVAAINPSAPTREKLFAAFRCPVNSCRAIYLGIYTRAQRGATFDLVRAVLPFYSQAKEFATSIKELSPHFCTIYNQALAAEDNGLNLICGPGYRKALEFLMKDFIIHYKFKIDPVASDDDKKKLLAKHEQVKSSFLGSVINDFIDDDNIKDCASRAVWLGNDETHYTRLWEDKDLADLKRLIELAVLHTESVIATDEYRKAMPKRK